jgi:hypothetical protein
MSSLQMSSSQMSSTQMSSSQMSSQMVVIQPLLQGLNKELLCMILLFLPFLDKLLILNLLAIDKEFFIENITKSLDPQLSSIKGSTIFATHEYYRLLHIAQSLTSADISEGNERIQWELYPFDRHTIIHIISMNGNLELLKSFRQFSNLGAYYKAAIYSGHVHILNWLYENNYEWDKKTDNVYRIEAKKFIPVIQWLIDHEYSLNEYIFIAGIKTCSLENISWLMANNCPYNKLVFYEATMGGDVEVLKYLHSHGYSFCDNFIVSNHGANSLAKNGHFAALQWWYSINSASFNRDTFISAILGSHLNIIEWMAQLPEYSKHYINANDAISCYFYAIEKNKEEKTNILNWLYDNGHSLLDEGLLYAFAARFNRINILRWLLDHNCPFDIDDLECLTIEAAKSGNLDILKWMLANNLYVDMHICAINATITENNSLCVLEWLLTEKLGFWDQNAYLVEIKEDDCWDEDLCDYAVTLGLFNLLQWLIEKECPCNMNICSITAAAYGHLDILKWLIECKGVALNKTFCLYAAEKGHLHILKWLIDDNSCPYELDECVHHAKESYSFGILQWLSLKST